MQLHNQIMGKIQTTLLIEEDLWKKFRKIAIDEGKSASQLIEEFIKNKVEGKKR
jgi:predicted DNA-binding ribbon-helix-helix protein